MILPPIPLAGVYAITPCGTLDFGEILRRSALLLGGGLCALQYRDKGTGDSEKQVRAARLHALCRAHGTPLIINDDPRLALAINAEGVHLGADDPDPAWARELLGPSAIIGVSCYDDVGKAVQASASGADYVALGAFFPTATKTPRARATLATLRSARTRISRPIVAIGGITPENSAELVSAGADALAIVSALYDADDPHYQLQRFQTLFSDPGEPRP